LQGAGSHRQFRFLRAYNFTVPDGVTNVTVIASGAFGGFHISNSGNVNGNGGYGAVIRATILVTPGETLGVFVGSWRRCRVYQRLSWTRRYRRPRRQEPRGRWP